MSTKQLQVVLCSGTDSVQSVPTPSEHSQTQITYHLLTEFHLERIKLNKDGQPRSLQSLKNQRSGINSWRKFNELDESSVVGEELGVKFNDCLASYLAYLAKQSKSGQTPSDRKSTVVNLRESFKDLVRTSGLPQSFAGALTALVENSGLSFRRIALKTGVGATAVRSWTRGTSVPSVRSLLKIQRLEDYFQVHRGILSSRIPVALKDKAPCGSGGTAWRKQQGVLCNLPYYLNAFPSQLDHEWNDLLLFFTDTEWVEEKGLERNSVWRVRWNNGQCITGDMRKKTLAAFFGYLCLSPIHEDRRLRGQGFCIDNLSLALFSDADLIRNYLYFRRGRTVSQSFNSHTKGFLAFCSQLLRPQTGYLWQLPSFGSMLPQKVTPDKWHDWCETNHRKLSEFRNKIRKNKKDSFKMTRDPFEAVRDIIEGRQHPITALFELSSKLESITPLMQNYSPLLRAIHSRDIFLIRFISSNPLRIENLSMMTYIPKDYGAFGRACELYARASETKAQIDPTSFYLETSRESNLYQRSDGSWRLRFDERDFKNEKGEDLEKGVAHAPYDVEVVSSVWPALYDYLFKHRSVLNQELKLTINKRRILQNLPELSKTQMQDIDKCPYVFRPSREIAQGMHMENFLKFQGTEQIPPRSLSIRIYRRSQQYLPGCPGFSAHACRHLVATEYIKNHPNGEAVAAAALHNTILMTRKHYAWVTPADRIKPWNDYYEELHKKYEDDDL